MWVTLEWHPYWYNAPVPRNFVFTIKIAEGGVGGLSYLDKFKLKKHCKIVMRSLKLFHCHKQSYIPSHHESMGMCTGTCWCMLWKIISSDSYWFPMAMTWGSSWNNSSSLNNLMYFDWMHWMKLVEVVEVFSVKIITRDVVCLLHCWTFSKLQITYEIGLLLNDSTLTQPIL